MSAVETAPVFDAAAAEGLAEPADIVVVNRTDGSEVERLSVIRYGGHYRVKGVDAFAVRDAKGKFRLRSARQLGLTEDSSFVAYIVLD